VPFFAELGRYLGSANTRMQLLGYLLEHIYLALVPLVLGIVVAVVAAWAGKRWSRLRPVVLVVSNLLYTIPSLALFVVIPGIIGSKILDSINVVLALTIYTAALLVRPVLDALDAVPSHVISTATAIGYRPVPVSRGGAAAGRAGADGRGPCGVGEQHQPGQRRRPDRDGRSRASPTGSSGSTSRRSSSASCSPSCWRWWSTSCSC
jgi:hypothetical protein